MAQQLLVGIDIGTGSSKGVLVTLTGEVIALSEQPHHLSLPKPGWAEHDAETIWWADFKAICDELVAAAGDDEIAGIAISGIGPCFLAAGENAEPLRPGILYGIDTRAMAEVHELTEKYGEGRITKRCGNPMNAQSIGAKILWLRRHEPEIYDQTRYFFMAHTFLAHRLTGVYYLDHISASYSEPLYHVGKNKWNDKWVKDIAPGLPMPQLKWPTDVIGHITAEGAERSGLPEGIPVAAGTMDSFADAMSVGVRQPGDAVVIYGSTMSIVLVTDESLPSAQLWSNAHLFENTYNLASGMATSGSLTKWLRDVCGNVDFAQLTTEAEAVAPGSDGLVILPYFAGERTPLLDPDARGTIIGLTLNHGRGHLYRALMEATAYGARHVLEVMHDAGGTGRRAYAVGGGTKGGLWPQIISDITGLTQELAEQSVGACYGDAMLIGVAGGFIDADADWSPKVGTIEPNPDNQARYDELYRIFRRLHPATVDLQHELAAIQNG